MTSGVQMNIGASMLLHGKQLLRQMRLKGAAHPVLSNACSLFAVQAAGYLLPLVTIPYLARVLQPAGLGVVLYAQTFSAWVVMLMEYGFNLSATREIARYRDDPARLAGIVAGVMGAKLLLGGAVVVLSLALWRWVPMFRQYPALLWWALAVTLVTGFSPLWYFQGEERLAKPARFDICFRALAVAGILLLVKSAVDGWRVLAIQALAGLLTTWVMVGWMYRRVRPQWPRRQEVTAALRRGWMLFVFRGAVSLYTAANVVVLGFFVTPLLVGIFAGAERIARGVQGLLGPLSTALYPRMSHLTAHQPERAAQVTRLALLLMAAVGLALGLALALTAPLVVHLLLGRGYEGSMPVLRVLALLSPLIAISNVLGIQRMLPLGMDGAFSGIIISAGVLNLGLVALLVPPFGIMGMAWAIVAAELVVVIGMWGVLWRHKAL